MRQVGISAAVEIIEANLELLIPALPDIHSQGWVYDETKETQQVKQT